MSDRISVLATEAIPAGAPLRVTGSLGQGLWQVAIANTATESVDGWAPAAIANGKRGYMDSEGEGKVSVGATVVALSDPVTDGGDGYFGNAGTINFGRYLGAKDANNRALALMDDLGSIGQAAAAGSGLPTDVFMDEYGNVIMGAVNIAAFALVDNTGGRISNCWVDSTARVVWPPPVTVTVNALKAYGQADLDFGAMDVGSIDGLVVAHSTGSLEVTAPVNAATIASVLMAGAGAITIDTTGGTVSIADSSFLSGANGDFGTDTGGSIAITGSTFEANAYLSLLPAAALSITASRFGGSGTLSLSPAAATTLVKCAIEGRLWIVGNTGPVDLTQVDVAPGADLKCDGVLAPGASVVKTSLFASGDLRVTGDSAVSESTFAFASGSIDTNGHDVSGVTVMAGAIGAVLLSGANTDTYRGFAGDTLVD